MRGTELELFPIGLLEPLAAAVVDQQPPGHRREKRAGLTGRDIGTGGEQADEGVLSDVRRVVRTLQATAQPAEQPLMVSLVQRIDAFDGSGPAGIHGGDIK
ncbi:hypothetical protein D3C78_1307230 [compost metagenome]